MAKHTYPGRDESPTAADSSPTRANTDRVLRMAEVERRAIVEALRACGGCVARASRALGISEATIYRKMRTYGIQRRSLID
jgi:transcriptional regulator of acetoin/glycerol metabolism